jgi:putative SbcD/Mre11-related phosphoesterase
MATRTQQTRTAPWLGLHAGPDGWWLAPEGAALHPGEGVAVVADVHLGYEWSRGSGGDVVPAHSLAETVTKLEALLGRGVAVGRLIVAGDLVESSTPCPRTARDVARLRGWLAGRGVMLERLRGNHDAPARPPLPATAEVGGWTIAHGDRPTDESARVISGHHHPALRAGGTSSPCFLVGPSAIVLPAFSSNAAGWNVAAGRPAGFRFDPKALRCLAPAGADWLDFGTLAELAARLVGG